MATAKKKPVAKKQPRKNPPQKKHQQKKQLTQKQNQITSEKDNRKSKIGNRNPKTRLKPTAHREFGQFNYRRRAVSDDRAEQLRREPARTRPPTPQRSRA